MPNLFGRPLWSYLPIGNIEYSKQTNQNSTGIKCIFDIVYALTGMFYIVAYPIFVWETGAFDPISQTRVIVKKVQRSNELNKKIFGPYGYADTNFDKIVDIKEKANAYSKIGLTNFPRDGLTLEQLEELVKKYEE